MSIDAAEALRIVVQGVEAGHSAVRVAAVSPEAAGGARLVYLLGPSGTERVHGTLGSAALDDEATAAARSALDDPRSRDGLRSLTSDGVEVFLEVRRPVRDLVIVGAGHIARPMSQMGSMLGFRVWVLDDRPDFATRDRFPDADHLIRTDFSDPFADVPIHARSHVLLVTRGHRYDFDCLVRVMGMDPLPAYIGMIGSRRRVRATFVQLVDEGIPRALLARINAPVGLDIGAETPVEIAIAVAAELVKLARGGTGASLKDVEDITGRFFDDAKPSSGEEHV
jgi:xanthine dehydrogenase accessory factor